MAPPCPLVVESGINELDHGLLAEEVLCLRPVDGVVDCSGNGDILENGDIPVVGPVR